jgi:hypothetical protein
MLHLAEGMKIILLSKRREWSNSFDQWECEIDGDSPVLALKTEIFKGHPNLKGYPFRDRNIQIDLLTPEYELLRDDMVLKELIGGQVIIRW